MKSSELPHTSSQSCERALATLGSQFLKTTLSHTSRGTRLGDGWADIIFNVTFHALIQQLRAQLKELQLWMTIPLYETRSLDVNRRQGTDEVAHVTWADDLALPLLFGKPKTLVAHCLL